ncbi:RNA polymerase factor sigma-54 [Stenotrophomonas mori]|uniref:RNA polymerase sigma-54 factor n=1 Tax=Stenotrophomonas mori TaxID=2871096 RepID=A0ABT0SDC2_9GAMM|nr:RNA polymerase factor sigma-54 [Stenotrophomonas mori]MCL7713313.1 RNA polymerase factor sigma-54 [Stenotrophomonas mori]
MKAQLQTSLGQHLVMTPQLRQAIRLLQMAQPELEQELALAVESNPLLEWAEDAVPDDDGAPEAAAEDHDADDGDDRDDGSDADAQWSGGRGGSFDGDDEDDATQRLAETDTLAGHLSWQLHLAPLSDRDRAIGAALIDALDEDGYLREPLAAIAATLRPDLLVGEDEVRVVLRRIQRFDPAGVGATSLGECLSLQLDALPPATPALALARRIASDALPRLPRAGIAGLAEELRQPADAVADAVRLLRSLDPKPGRRLGGIASSDYVVPDCTVWRQRGVWKAALAGHAGPPVVIHRGYEGLIRQCGDQDASYLRGQLQEARWLLKALEARGETLLRVVERLLHHQSGFLEFGPQALRPLTLREIAAELELHESTISRAIAGKHVRTPRGTLPLRAFFASGIGTEGGGEASSTAIQSMIRRLIDAENPRKPLSDAKLAEMLKSSGVPVARRTVAKYREAMNICASHERVRLA